MSKIKQESEFDQSSSNLSMGSDDETDTLQHREKYSAERLMMMLDKQRLRALKKEFKDHAEGIELPNFVWLMKCALNVAEEEQMDLVLGLYYLFQEVDINGDEHMEWSEFTQYIIDTVINQQTREKLGNKEQSPSEILDIAYSLKHIRFQPSLNYDKNIHTGNVKYLAYYHSLDFVGFFEQNSKVFKLVDHNMELKHQLHPEISSEAFIVTAAYSEQEALLVLVSSDRRFHRYEKDKDTFRKLELKSFQQTSKFIESLWYFEKLKMWISACKDNNLRQHNMRELDTIITFKGHNQKIMDVVEIVKPLSLASCSLDQFVIIWNTVDGSKLGTISTGHLKGIRSMDYCVDYGGNLLTMGFERDIKIWNPESNLLKCYIGKLEGHSKAIICCKYFKGKGICASLDEEGSIRIWDIRQQICLQIISNEKLSIEVSKLVILPKHEKFMLAGKRLMTFELIHNSANYEKLYEIKPIMVEFNSYYMQFAVLTRFDLRIYDCVTGRLKKVFTKIIGNEEAELSSMCLDKRNRVVIVGDSLGSLRTYNFFNGSLLKTIRDQADSSIKVSKIQGNECADYSEISTFCNCFDDNILIAATWDSSLMFFNIKNISDVCLLRHLKGGHGESDITAVAYSPFLSFVASVSSNGIVAVWDFEKGNLERAFFVHQHKVTSLMFLDPFPLLLTCAKDGTCCLWEIKRDEIQSEVKVFVFKSLNEIVGKDFVTICYNLTENLIKEAPNPTQTESTKTPSSNSSMQVYIGTSRGSIKFWDFSSLIHKLKLHPQHSQARDRAGYNPFRKDKKNAAGDLAYWKKQATNNLSLIPLSLEKKIQKNEWQGHSDQIITLKYISDPRSLLTCSLDRLLKIWTLEGENWGVINLAVPELPRKWYFPFKWKKRRKKDLEQVFELLKLIDSEIQMKPIDKGKKKVKKEVELGDRKKKKKNLNFERFSFNQPEQSKFQFWAESSFDEEIHKEEKKSEPVVNDEKVAELRRKLEEIDERNGKEVIKAYREPTLKLKDDHEKSKHTKKLPYINQKIETKLLTDQKSHKKKLAESTSKKYSNTFKSRQLFGSFNHLSKGKLKIQSPCFKPNVIVNSDVKFLKGESDRLISKAMSVEQLSRCSKILPFTEDLHTLKSIQKEFSSFKTKNF